MFQPPIHEGEISAEMVLSKSKGMICMLTLSNQDHLCAQGNSDPWARMRKCAEYLGQRGGGFKILCVSKAKFSHIF